MGRKLNVFQSIGLIVFAIVAGSLLGALSAKADSYRHNEGAITTVIDQADECELGALSAAGDNNHIDYGNKRPQLSLGLGGCGDVLGLSLMGGYRPCNTCPVFSLSSGKAGDLKTIGAGLLVVF